MVTHTALDEIGGRGAVNASAPNLTRVGKMRASDKEGEPTIIAVLERGPLAGRRIHVDTVEGRPPKTIDVRADDGCTCRYCLAEWVQTGSSATYTFLYPVEPLQLTVETDIVDESLYGRNRPLLVGGLGPRKDGRCRT